MAMRLAVLALLAAVGACAAGPDASRDLPDETTPDLPDGSQPDLPDVPPDLPDSAPHDESADRAADVPADTPPEASPADVPPDGDIPTAVDPGGLDADPLPPLPTRSPLAVPPDPLAGTGFESCSVFRAERCSEGVLRRCDVYDALDRAWVDEPDPLLKRAYLFDRWRDLYNSPDGQAVDRDFVGAVMPGTPEADWGRPEAFKGYFGAGDGGIWTGWSTVAAVLRYSQTGTEADYQRMEQHVRDMVTMFDVTGIPGYLSRFHFLLLPTGAPNSPDHILRWEGSFTPGHLYRAIPDPATVPNLPAIYTEGLPDAQGTVWKGVPMWHGRPSIDQATGPMTSLPMAWGLLRDEALKGRIVRHLTCYLKRLQRIEVINLRSNPEILQVLLGYFSSGGLQLDPDDIDFTKVDRIVGYVHRQINSLNEATFDRSCPEAVQTVPWRVIDAASEDFLADLLELIQDLDHTVERENGIDHPYFPSIRGGDAMHLLHLAAMAWHFTGDDLYREFLHRELLGNVEVLPVVHAAGVFDFPKYCKHWYDDQIMFGPWWAFLELLADGPLRTELAEAYHAEMWKKLIEGTRNVDFGIMYAGAVPPGMAADRDAALASALDDLRWMGGDGGLLMGDAFDPRWLNDPRRSYGISRDQVMAAAGDIEAVCPTAQEEASCSARITYLGMTLPNFLGWSPHACSGSPWDCEVEGGCDTQQASAALPVPLRRYTDYLWQRNPYELGAGASPQGHIQYAGSDYSVPYWNARRYGFLQQGAADVLAWRDAGACR